MRSPWYGELSMFSTECGPSASIQLAFGPGCGGH